MKPVFVLFMVAYAALPSQGSTGRNSNSNLVLPSPEESVSLGASWLMNQRDADYGWNIDTHRMITTLQLTGRRLEEETGLDAKLSIKQLELQLALALAKHHQEPLSTGQLALYVNALLSLCQNPRDFYGLNLVSRLKHPHDSPNQYSFALIALALCNSHVHVSSSTKRRLILIANNTDQGIPDTRAMAVMALSCVGEYENNHSRDHHHTVRDAIKDFKESQRPDGSFGNIYSSGIVYQALIAAKASESNWNRTKALEYLMSQQSSDGSFGPAIASYFALPGLAGVSLASIGNKNCSNSTRVTQILDLDHIQNRQGQDNATGTVIADITVYVNDRLIEFKNIWVNNGTTLYGVLNSQFTCEWRITSFGRMLISLNGFAQDVAHHRYWMFYTIEKNADGEPYEKALEVGAEGFRFVKDTDVVLKLKAMPNV